MPYIASLLWRKVAIETVRNFASSDMVTQLNCFKEALR